jgi:hypothetical protein
MNLYNIQNEFLLITRELMENGGEATPEIEQALSINKEQLQAKGINYALCSMHLESEITAIDNEIKRLETMKRIRKNTQARLESTLENAMNLYEIDEIKGDTVKVNFRKSESVEIIDVEKIPKDYMTVELTKKVDKATIKKVLKRGEEVPGAVLNQNKNLQIK